MKHKILNEKSSENNRKIGYYLAFVAGALNAGGFLAIGRYTSHMTGIVSEFADNIFLQNWDILKLTSFSFLMFLLGAFFSSLLINIGRIIRMKSNYSIVLLLEGVLILGFGLGAMYYTMPEMWVIGLLCFIMGLQNATMTKISRAVIRTTHVTGMTTDIGIELAKIFIKKLFGKQNIIVNYLGLKLHVITITTFVLGGICGSFGFGVYGYKYVIPLALILFMMAIPPIKHEITIFSRLKRFKKLAKVSVG